MNLPNGITGFFNSKNGQSPKVDGKQFKQVCFTISTRSRGKVLEFKEPQYPTNFYNVEVKIINKHLYILLNEHYPYLAFASVVEFGNIKFIDEPDLIKQFSSFYKVLGTKELNEPLSLRFGSKKSILQNANELNSAELEQIAYWKPEKVGEVIFNYWD